MLSPSPYTAGGGGPKPSEIRRLIQSYRHLQAMVSSHIGAVYDPSENLRVQNLAKEILITLVPAPPPSSLPMSSLFKVSKKVSLLFKDCNPVTECFYYMYAGWLALNIMYVASPVYLIPLSISIASLRLIYNAQLLLHLHSKFEPHPQYRISDHRTWKHACFCAFLFKIYMKAQNMHVFMYFLHLMPPLPHNGKGSINAVNQSKYPKE